jgi:hypothetical protein
VSWFRVDDGFPQHPKAMECSNAAIGLWTLTGAWCSSQTPRTGFVSHGVAKRYADDLTLTDELVRAGLWEVVDGGWQIHNFEAYGPPEDLAAKRAAAGRKGGAARHSKPSKTQANALANARGVDKQMPEQLLSKGSPESRDPSPGIQTPVIPDSRRPEIQVSQPPVAHPNSATAKSGADAVQAVWAEYLQATGRSDRTRLTPERRALIRNRLIRYPLADLVDAVWGWQNSPHHRGENPEGRTWNDLELLLRIGRNGNNLERFRDLRRLPPVPHGRDQQNQRIYDRWVRPTDGQEENNHHDESGIWPIVVDAAGAMAQ